MVLRAVVDSNVFVSALIVRGGYPAAVLDLAVARQFTLISSPAQLLELERVLSRPKFKTRYQITDESRFDFLGLIRSLSEDPASAVTSIDFVRDPKDRYLVELALSGNVDWLVSGDVHLLELASHPRLSAVKLGTPTDFCRHILE